MDSPSPLHITIDDRERGCCAAIALEAAPGVACSFRRLQVGDYLVGGRLLVERKTLPDLLQSIEDGRLFRQARRLATSRVPSLLLLEGTAADLQGRRFSRQAIQGALITTSLLWGVPLLRARDGEETAQLMVFAGRQLAAAVHGFIYRPGLRRGSKRGLQSHILQGLPGVGPNLALRLLDRFGTVGNVLQAPEATLRDVVGIGPRKAGKIRWAVNEEAIPYTAEGA
ncbi:MAG: nuclease [Acidobacteria bacterium]|nr:nuclease [Acidobacteriota bacterium]